MNTRHTVFKIPARIATRQTLMLALMLCLLVFIGVGLTWSALTLAAPADDAPAATLATTPDKCISLRKGQTCYQKIRVNWTASRIGDYCLMQQDRERPIHCWQNLAFGTARLELVAKTNTLLQLLDMSSGQEVANTQVKLAWVYKERKKSKRSWRLF